MAALLNPCALPAPRPFVPPPPLPRHPLPQVYVKPGVTEVRNIEFPKLELQEQKRKCQHGVILKVVATNICGSDQHMVRGRTTAPEGLVLGHEVRVAAA